MADPMLPPDDAQLPAELHDLLRQPSAFDPAAMARQADNIMTAVRDMPAPRRWSLPPTMTRWRRRGVLAPAGGIAVAFLLTMWMGVTSLTEVFSRSSAMLARVEVIGDTVLPRVAPAYPHDDVREQGALRRALRDTLYDTLRIVRFALRAPSASQVTLVDSDSLIGEVARDLASGLWELRTVVPRDAVSRAFAFVVDDVHRVPVRGRVTRTVFESRDEPRAAGTF